jgi:hypothetical protein
MRIVLCPDLCGLEMRMETDVIISGVVIIWAIGKGANAMAGSM